MEIQKFLKKSSILILLLGYFFSLGVVNKTIAATVESIKIISYDNRENEITSEFEIVLLKTNYLGKLSIIDIEYNLRELERKELIESKHDPISSKKRIEYLTTNKQIFDNISVKKENVDQFIERLTKNPLNELDVNQFGITRKWLSQQAIAVLEEELQDYSAEDYPNLEIRKQNVLKRISNLSFNLKKLKGYYSSSWTDDEPYLEITIHYDDNSSVRIYSKNQHYFMIPWTIESGGKKYKNYDIEISKALRNLHPQNFVNIDRFNEDLLVVFKRDLWDKEFWQLKATLSSEKVLDAKLLPITRKDFLIQKSMLMGASDNQENLNVEMRHKSWPSNLSINIILPVKKNGLDLRRFTPDKFLEYGNHILSIPWLKKYFLEHPHSAISIDYRNTLPTIDLKGKILLKIFNEDYGASDWEIYPDKKSQLVSFYGDHVLHWNFDQITEKKKDRWKYKTSMFISPEGEIINP